MWALKAGLLACPRCRAPLGAPPPGQPPPAACPGCGLTVDLRGPVARLLPPGAPASAERRTVLAFERQWASYGRLQRLFGKDPGAMARNLVGPRVNGRDAPGGGGPGPIDAAWYRGRRVLDAGCGHGRYLSAFAALGAAVVGLDIGRGPEQAGAPLDVDEPGGRRIQVVQGSVLAPPFADASFDLVFSDGVIHHTPDARAAYLALARLVKPGGALYVWVYPREGRLREAVFGLGRALTTRLPGAAVRALCFALAPLTLFVRSYSGTNLARATWAECAQVVHDWIAPPLQSHHTEAEVRGWAAEAGLVDARALPIPVGLTAWRPVAEAGARPPGR